VSNGSSGGRDKFSSKKGGRHEIRCQQTHDRPAYCTVRRARRQLGRQRGDLRLHRELRLYAQTRDDQRAEAVQLQVDTETSNDATGAQYGMPSAGYRGCMLPHGWKFRSLTRTRVNAAPADPYFSSNVKVAPGHFIDHDAPLKRGTKNHCELCGLAAKGRANGNH
jgi:hypothetical protein